MSNRLQSISTNPTLREYAQGAAKANIQPVADFLAPSVEVATTTGKYKLYSEKNRFRIPQTARAIGGQATRITLDATYNCSPHALEHPVDDLEKLESEQLESAIQEGADLVSEAAALTHEHSVITAALETVGSGTDYNFTDNAFDPVALLDIEILRLIKQANYGSKMGIGVLFGTTAWMRTKNNLLVRSQFPVGTRKKSRAPTLEEFNLLLLGEVESQVSYMVMDQAPEGLDANYEFLLDEAILIFLRRSSPSRRDPSFMKTFRLRGQWMKPISYRDERARSDVVGFDWTEDVQVTNTAGAVRINAKNA